MQRGYLTTDYCPLLLFHIGSNLKNTKRDYKALGEATKDSVVQTALPAILPIKGKRFERTDRIGNTNKYLREWCPGQ